MSSWVTDPSLFANFLQTPLTAQVAPTALLEGQPVTIAAIFAMVLVVWILAPVVKQAFTFALTLIPAVQKLSDAAGKLVEEVKDIQGTIGDIQKSNVQRDLIIEADRKRVEDQQRAMKEEILAVKQDVSGLHGKLDTILQRLPPAAPVAATAVATSS
jgi:hypothetical protein